MQVRPIREIQILPTRRMFSVAAASCALLSLRIPRAAAFVGVEHALTMRFSEIESSIDGRLGVAVVNNRGTLVAHHRAHERFPLCSTFKLLLVAAILAKADGGRGDLARRIDVHPRDILSYAPVTREHAGGFMTVAQLCEAAITVSDNTAANLLIADLGGPGAITAFARSIGDGVSRLDRMEPALNSAVHGDLRDTTTPAAMAQDARRLVLGHALSREARDRLTQWLVACTTGADKLRAGLPAGWRVGDKTGSGDNGASNDVAIVWPQKSAPLVIASYITETKADASQTNAAHAAVARAVADALG